MYSESTYRVVRKAVVLTHGACVVLVLFLVGLRIGEFARIDHDCLIKQTDSNGIDVIRVQGIAAKQGGKQRSWIACEEVEVAVKQILRFNANARKGSGRKSLWINEGVGVFFRLGYRIRRTPSAMLTHYLKSFANASFRSSAPHIT
ncbi:hypothetical protein WDZ92_50700, partial [Nostoc sp. NIES-2111]